MLKKIAKSFLSMIISEAFAAEESDDAGALYAQGITLIRAGNLGEAFTIFNKLVKMDIKNEKIRQIRDKIEQKINEAATATVAGSAEKIVEDLYNEGNAMMEIAMYADAAACFEKALAIKPRNTVLWYRRGLALHRLGKHGDAISCMERALEVNPSFADAWYIKGACLNNIGRPDDALACFDRIVEIEPDHVPFKD